MVIMQLSVIHHAKMRVGVPHQEYVPVQEAGVVSSVNKVQV